jgi:glycerol-3-phosphate dehydrogenase (NAD(P)+)
MDKQLKKQQPLPKIKVAIIGDGSWATALFNTISDNGFDVYWWVRLPETIEYIKKHHRNPDFLRTLGLTIDPKKISSDISEIVKKADVLIFAIPSVYFHDSLKNLHKNDLQNKLVVSAIKGILPRTHEMISYYFSNHFAVPADKYVFLTGPSHAEEVADQRLTYLTLASSSDTSIETVKKIIKNDFIKVRSSDDIIGLEYATVLKNIYAIAVGICHGLGFGDNFLAVFTANAAREMKEFLDIAAPANRKICGSAFLGDLMVTTFSQFSRNRTFGGMIGKGYSVKSALVEMNMVPEGYYAVNSIYSVLKKYPVKMHIVESVYQILYKKQPVQEEIQKLLKYFI